MRLVGTLARRGLASVALFVVLTFAVGCDTDSGVPDLERRAQELNKSIMCPVCPGESIDQSQHPLAVQMRGIVADRLEDGWTAGRINDYFVDRYGPSVLLEPPREGSNILVWIVPPLGVGRAVLFLYMAIRGMRRRDASGEASEPPLSQEERERYFARIRAIQDDEPVAASPEQPAGPEGGV